MNELLPGLYDAVLNGDAKSAVALTSAALDAGADPLDLVEKCMVPAMDEVGRRFESEEYFIPELLLAGRAMKGAVELLRPLLAARGVAPAGKVVIGTVKGDLHDIGKNLVSFMLEGAGFEVVDLGVDVPPERFIDAVRKTGANIVALSALLTVTMPAIGTTIQALRAAGLRERVRIIVGGAPVNHGYANEVGADGYSASAAGAVTAVRGLMEASCR